MHTQTLLLAFVTFFGATAAVASDATIDTGAPFVSTSTRADVRLAVLQARAAGVVNEAEATLFPLSGDSQLSLAQVVAETLEAIRVGAIGRGERNVFPTAKQLESIRVAGLLAVPMTLAAR